MPRGNIKLKDYLGDIFLIWTYFGHAFCWKSEGESGLSDFGLVWWTMMDLTYFCVTQIAMLIFLLYIVHGTWQKELLRGFRHFKGVLVERETDPSVPPHPPPHPVTRSFPSPPFFFPFSLSLKHSHSRKNPIIEISGPCWKRDSLWNVFGVKQRQCLSCPSANRMLCAGERREIRTDNCKGEDQKKRTTKGAEDNMDREKKKTKQQRWSDDPKSDRSRAIVQLQYH